MMNRVCRLTIEVSIEIGIVLITIVAYSFNVYCMDAIHAIHVDVSKKHFIAASSPAIALLAYVMKLSYDIFFIPEDKKGELDRSSGYKHVQCTTVLGLIFLFLFIASYAYIIAYPTDCSSTIILLGSIIGMAYTAVSVGCSSIRLRRLARRIKPRRIKR